MYDAVISDMGDLIKSLNSILREEDILEREPMSRHTTFKTGGEAAYFLTVSDEETLMSVVDLLHKDGVPYFVLGNGSNILVSDKGYEGAVIRLSGEFSGISSSGTTVKAGAGAKLSELAAYARDNAFSGLVFASGIPGTVGGALIMNAGAFGGEIADVCGKVRVFTPAGGGISVLDAAEMEFGYRTSRVKGTGDIILSAVFYLKQGDRDEISRAMDELCARRKAKQPIELPSAGSTFKRPEGEGLYAGKLIEEAGLRGFRNGGAAVSEKHCGFIVNDRQATSAEIFELIQTVIDKVYCKSGIRLEPEVLFLGRF